MKINALTKVKKDVKILYIVEEQTPHYQRRNRNEK